MTLQQEKAVLDYLYSKWLVDSDELAYKLNITKESLEFLLTRLIDKKLVKKEVVEGCPVYYYLTWRGHFTARPIIKGPGWSWPNFLK